MTTRAEVYLGLTCFLTFIGVNIIVAPRFVDGLLFNVIYFPPYAALCWWGAGWLIDLSEEYNRERRKSHG